MPKTSAMIAIADAVAIAEVAMAATGTCENCEGVPVIPEWGTVRDALGRSHAPTCACYDGVLGCPGPKDEPCYLHRAETRRMPLLTREEVDGAVEELEVPGEASEEVLDVSEEGLEWPECEGTELLFPDLEVVSGDDGGGGA